MALDPKANFAPDHVENIHLMGIGGVAMGALAGALKKKGFSVTGSDLAIYPPMSTFLAEKGIVAMQGYRPANLEPSPDLVIVGNVIRRENPEALALAETGIPYISLPQALAHFFICDRLSIVVAGTHGKTTTTALVAEGLERCGLEPGFMVGGLMSDSGRNFEDGQGGVFVVEGDEYDTAFFDKRPKFVHYRPRIGILTSCEFDHADIYADMDAIRNSFDSFASLIPPQGTLVAWGDSAEVMKRAEKSRARVITYGRSDDCDWRLLEASPAGRGGAALSVRDPNGVLFTIASPMPGLHNALNTVAGLAAMVEAGAAPDRAAEAMARFGGVRRRQETKGIADGVMVVDDFAHHPTAVKETIQAIADFGLPGWSPGSGRLVAVFEPRTNTSKQNIFQVQYESSFDRADLVLLREPPAVESLAPEKRFSSERLAESLRTRGRSASAHPDTDSLLHELMDKLNPGDLCLVMSNGGFDNLHQRLLEALARR